MEICDSFFIDDEFELEEETHLRPMSHMSPPNSIITKYYEPDVTPNIKLILQQQPDTRPQQSILTEQSKIINSVIASYCDTFQPEDYLGYYYSGSFESLVFLKMHNRDKNLLKLSDTKARLMSSFFIPPESYRDFSLKNSDGFLKALNQPNSLANSEIDLNIDSKHFFVSANPTNAKFGSNFDSGNLFAAYKSSPTEYDCIMQNDINSRGSTQWFHFSVQLPEVATYRFNIVNFTKSSSLYEEGLQVVACSGRNDYNKAGQGWHKAGKVLNYSRTEIKRQLRGGKEYYYQLSFTYKTKAKNETVSFASTYPYTCLDAEKFFNRVAFKKIGQNLRMQKHIICETIGGAPVYVYAISHKRSRQSLTPGLSLGDLLARHSTVGFERSATREGIIQSRATTSLFNKAKAVVFMARQHPGEPQSSFILEGLVEGLLENSDSQIVKRRSVFYFIPMVNPDGVKYGNYRSNLSGNDLNRVWRNPHRDFHPEVIAVKRFLSEVNKVTPISLIMDIHGHSRAMGSFFYGNPNRKDALEDSKLFPYLCSKRIKQVSFQQCTFHIKEDKKNSARVVLGEMFPKAMVYTFENSFYGWNQPKKDNTGNQVMEFTPDHYRQLGHELLGSYIEYVRLCDKNQSAKEKWMKEMEVEGISIGGGADSDSDAQADHIELESSKEPEVERSPRRIEVERSPIQRISLKKKTHLVPRTIVPGQTKLLVSNQSQEAQIINPLIKQDTRNMSEQNRNQSVLSILKINTLQPKTVKLDEEEEKQEPQFVTIQEGKVMMRKDLYSRQSGKGLRIEDAIKSTLGMKKFLKAMGASIEKRKTIIRNTNIDDLRA